MNDINELRRLALDGDLAAMQEIILRLEAAEKSDAESIAMYRKARDERDALRAKIETTENDAAHQKALAESALRVAEGWERKCGELRAALQHEADCVEAAKTKIEALRAKIEAMEQQEPVWFIDERGEPKRYHKSKADYCKYGGLDLLYTLPGAQTQGEGK